MFIGRVIGNIVSTAKRDELQAAKLFIVEVYNDKLEPTGKYEVSFDGSNHASGIYYYTMRSGKFLKTGKMILVK